MPNVDAVSAESGISLAATILSALGVAGTGIVGYIVLRVQRDMAKLKNEILEGINGKYINRREHEILCREHEAKMADAAANAKEARAQHHILHEEFIACRAKHEAEG